MFQIGDLVQAWGFREYAIGIYMGPTNRVVYDAYLVLIDGNVEIVLKENVIPYPTICDSRQSKKVCALH